MFNHSATQPSETLCGDERRRRKNERNKIWAAAHCLRRCRLFQWKMNSFGTRCSIIIEKLRGLPEYEDFNIAFRPHTTPAENAKKALRSLTRRWKICSPAFPSSFFSLLHGSGVTFNLRRNFHYFCWKGSTQHSCMFYKMVQFVSILNFVGLLLPCFTSARTIQSITSEHRMNRLMKINRSIFLWFMMKGFVRVPWNFQHLSALSELKL